MNGFERRKEQKKESILQAALELFMHYGFKKVSINDIAGKAGVSPVTIYNHFKSKDNLVLETVKMMMSDMMDRYRQIIDGEGSFPEKLETIVFDKAKIASRFQGELAPVLFREDPEMIELVEDIMKNSGIKMTLDLFQQGKKEGYIDESYSEETLTIYLEILRRGISASTEIMSQAERYPETVRNLNKLFIYGLIGKKEQK
jgi:AcrR family transcriptional regulator